MASFASSANTGGARKHTWTNLQFSCPVSDLMMKYFFCIQIHSAGQHNNICSNWYFKGFKFGLKITIIVWKNRCGQTFVIIFVGPGGFACATQGGVCNVQLAIVITNFCSLSLSFGPGGLRALPKVAFAMCSWPFLLPTFAISLTFFLLRLLLLIHFRETPEAEICFSQYLA